MLQVDQLSRSYHLVLKNMVGGFIGPKGDVIRGDERWSEMVEANADLLSGIEPEPHINSDAFQAYWESLQYLKSISNQGKGFFLCLGVAMETVKEYFHLSEDFPNLALLLAIYLREQMGFQFGNGRIINEVVNQLADDKILSVVDVPKPELSELISTSLDNGIVPVVQGSLFFPDLGTSSRFGHYFSVLRATETGDLILGGDFGPIGIESPFTRIARERFINFLSSSQNKMVNVLLLDRSRIMTPWDGTIPVSDLTGSDFRPKLQR